MEKKIGLIIILISMVVSSFFTAIGLLVILEEITLSPKFMAGMIIILSLDPLFTALGGVYNE